MSDDEADIFASIGDSFAKMHADLDDIERDLKSISKSLDGMKGDLDQAGRWMLGLLCVPVVAFIIGLLAVGFA